MSLLDEGDYHRRIEDYAPGKSWTEDQRNDGITRRLGYLAPGRDVLLRPGTEGLFYDSIKQITWGEVLQILIDVGVMKKDGDKVVKQIPAFGVDPKAKVETPYDFGLRDIVNKADIEKLKALNMRNPDQKRQFMEIRLGRSMREGVLKSGVPPEFLQFLPELALYAAASMVPSDCESSFISLNYARLCIGLETLFRNILIDKGFIFQILPRKIFFPDGRTSDHDWQKMFKDWAEGILYTLMYPYD